MKLCDLIKGISDKFSNVDVLDICDNSKNVTKDSLFVSIPCARQQEFLKEAISLGAKVVITFANENDIKNIDGVLYITIANVNPRKILAELASKMYINHVEKIVAITGTNGKTSTTHIVRDIWQNMSIKAASIGTLGIITNDKQEMLPNHLTSPGSLMLHKTLNRINADRVVMEASSHGIDQYRMAGLHFNVCAFTNFSEDHLDYHKTMENYWKAKSKLFQELAASNSVFVANADDPYCQKIATIAQQRNIHMITYGRKAKDFRLIKAEQVMNGQKIYIDIYNKSYNFFIPLLGDFQVYNAV